MKANIIGNIWFDEMNDGTDIPDEIRNSLINQALKEIKDGKTHTTISTGNFLVVAVKYDTGIQIFITKDYQTGTFKEEALEKLVAF